MLSFKTVFGRVIKATAKCTWWAILLNLCTIIMCVILVVLVIVMALITALSVAVTSVIITNMATSTSALIITVMIVIVIASVGGVKLLVVILVLAPIIILLSPSPLLGSSKGPSATLLTPIWSVASAITSGVLIMIVVVYLFIGFLFFWGRGRWLRLLLRF